MISLQSNLLGMVLHICYISHTHTHSHTLGLVIWFIYKFKTAYLVQKLNTVLLFLLQRFSYYGITPDGRRVGLLTKSEQCPISDDSVVCITKQKLISLKLS